MIAKNCTAPRKSMKVISYLKDEQVIEEFQKSFDDSSDVVFVGSTSTSAALGPSDAPAASVSTRPEPTPGTSFAPKVTSTPKYEDISEEEEDSEDDVFTEPMDVTFNHENDVVFENRENDGFMTEAKAFVKNAIIFMEKKRKKRQQLIIKYNIYKKKLLKVKAALDVVDNVLGKVEGIKRIMEQ